MMHSTGEHTPLLGRIDRGGNATQRRRPHDTVDLEQQNHWGGRSASGDDDEYYHSNDDDEEDDATTTNTDSLFSHVSHPYPEQEEQQEQSQSHNMHHNNINNKSSNYRRRMNDSYDEEFVAAAGRRGDDDDDDGGGGKNDRRNWTKRLMSVLSLQIQKNRATNKMMPATGTRATTATNHGGRTTTRTAQGIVTSSFPQYRGNHVGGVGSSSGSKLSSLSSSLSSSTRSDGRAAMAAAAASYANHERHHRKNDDDDDDSAMYYEDVFNDQSWKCSFGTREENGIWMNTNDRAGIIMAAMVWLLILYSAITMLLLTQSGHISNYWAAVYITICTLALASHAKTTFTDPGAVASSAIPLVIKGVKFHAMCSICQSYKPKYAHHCRICNRCVTRMDHHCPWMNNCVGAGNLKHFTLFLLYTWLCSGMALTLFTCNYFFCNSEDCEFTILEIQLVRVMSIVCISAWYFTSSMLMSVIYGLITGVGTIDRLKKNATNTWHLSDEEPIPWSDVMGSGPIWTWLLPVDPYFPDYDRVMGYATMQRLLREQNMEVAKRRVALASLAEL